MGPSVVKIPDIVHAMMNGMDSNACFVSENNTFLQILHIINLGRNNGYVKPMALKFKINHEIPIIRVVNTMPINFLDYWWPFEALAKYCKNKTPV